MVFDKVVNYYEVDSDINIKNNSNFKYADISINNMNDSVPESMINVRY